MDNIKIAVRLSNGKTEVVEINELDMKIYNELNDKYHYLQLENQNQQLKISSLNRVLKSVSRELQDLKEKQILNTSEGGKS